MNERENEGGFWENDRIAAEAGAREGGRDSVESGGFEPQTALKKRRLLAGREGVRKSHSSDLVEGFLNVRTDVAAGRVSEDTKG